MMANLQALESGDMYTVGWISALPLELAAATAMLDEEHDTPTDFNRSPSDQNIYSFGRIGEHNVVFASLPAGVYGTTSANTTAQQMLSSFPNIRIGLMVGIGAGVPKEPEHYDIRLGDVVVSQPDGTSGGVVQYDLGKAKADGSFERKGMLSQPPLALLNALGKLQGRHIKSASKISSYVNEMLEQFPLMKRRRPKTPSYMYQGVDHDKLFESAYLHVGGTSCTACESAREIPREARDSTDSKIHYGIIASGNTLVKDAVQRDKLAEGTGEECICFEMEAAGLMNTFPCVVIRGIRDYADSHKNDRWQGYAAATAAAYAKELLGVIPCADLQRTEKAIKVLNEVQKTVDNTNNNVNKLFSYALTDRLKDWLHAPDPSTNYNRAIQQHHSGTGLWFLESEAFADWRIQGNGLLWLHGLAGCGKTVLSSIIIEHLQKESPSPQTNLLYFFFDFNDKEKQSHENMIRTFVQQLCVQEEASRHLLEQLSERYAGRNEQPSLKSLEETFASMPNQAAHTRVVIDALDESCQQRKTLEWLRRISTDQRTASNKLNIIITSRREYDIDSAFLRWVPEDNVLPIRADDINKDISAFVHSQIQLNSRLERWRGRPDVQIEIKSKLIKKANGMFRWVICQLDTLEICLDLADLRNALDDLPDGLDETYSRILARVDTRNQEKAIAMLQLLVWAKSELTLDELVDALATRQGEDRLHYDSRNKMPLPNEILNIFPGLIALDRVESTNTWSENPHTVVRVWVRLAHLSVKEYLTSDRVHETFKSSLEELNAHIAISDMCIAYFYTSYLDARVRSDSEDSQETDGEVRNLPEFVSYLPYWTAHARIAQADGRASERIVKLLTSGFASDSPFGRCIGVTECQVSTSEIGKMCDVTALVYASSYGLDRIVPGLLERNAQAIDKLDTYYDMTALGAAKEFSHWEIVGILLVNGATPTMHVSEEERDIDQPATALRILDMLLDYGAKPTYADLVAAVHATNGRIVKFLLEKGTPIRETKDSRPFTLPDTTLLHIACQRDGFETVELLLDYGAEIDALDGQHKHALDLAGPDVEKLLLDRGADVTASRYGLHSTVRHQMREEMVSLLDNGADIDAQDEEGETALHVAVTSRKLLSAPWFVEKLLSRGANALIKDNQGETALGVLEGSMWAHDDDEEKECKSRIRSMLSKAMLGQSRSTEARSRT